MRAHTPGREAVCERAQPPPHDRLCARPNATHRAHYRPRPGRRTRARRCEMGRGRERVARHRQPAEQRSEIRPGERERNATRRHLPRVRSADFRGRATGRNRPPPSAGSLVSGCRREDAPRLSSRAALCLRYGVTMLNQNGNLSSMPTKSANASRLPSTFISPDVTACSGVISPS